MSGRICLRAVFALCSFAVVAGLSGCRMPDAPRRVKVVAIADMCPTNGFVTARTTNTDALSAAGYMPVVIPRVADTNLLAEAMDRADALLLIGGLKGQDYDGRMAFEQLLMRMALDRGLPVVGFCHGHQCINLYFGGKIGRIQKDNGDAPAVVHSGKESPYVKDCFHMVNVKPGSRLAKWLGKTRAEVNTSHVMRITELGDGLEATAWADDGVIEAIEHRTLPVTGFQFHPERIFRRDPSYLHIIRKALERTAGDGN